MKVQTPSKASPRPMQEWFTNELVDIYARVPVHHGLLLGCPVWGEAYIDRFVRYCLPSLFAPSNHATLAGSNALMVLYTDAEGFLRLQEVLSYVERLGMSVIVHVIPQDVLDDVAAREGAQYEVLGIVQNLCIKMAARCGAGYHMLMPDLFYGDGYMRNLALLTPEHEAILQHNISVDVDRFGPFVEKYRDENGFLVVPSVDLNTIGWHFRHRRIDTSVLPVSPDLPTVWPKVHIVVWKGEDELHICCPHANPIWLSPALCARAPMLPPSTVDAELPRLVPGHFYVPLPSDGLAFVEMSDDDKPSYKRDVTLNGFVKEWWARTNFDDAHLPFAEVCTRMKIKPDGGAFVETKNIEKQHNAMMDALIAGKKEAALNVVSSVVRYPTVMMGFGIPVMERV